MTGSSSEKECNDTPRKPNTAWMLTFADLLSLILTFFILMYSMTQLQQKEWDKVVQSLHQQFKVQKNAKSLEMPDINGIDVLNIPPALDLDYLSTLINQKIVKDSPLSNVPIRKDEDRLIISLENEIFFEQGSANLTDQALEILTFLGEILHTMSNRIDIYGNTDKSGINNALFPSNWELSLARAVIVAETLKQYGSQSYIQAYGLADSRYGDLPTTLTEEERNKLAQRVDIIIREQQSTVLKNPNEE